MKIKIAESTSCPIAPQFIVYAENDTERIILQRFYRLTYDAAWKFHLHGATYYCGKPGCDSFNFGWVQPIKVSCPLAISRFRRWLANIISPDPTCRFLP